MKKGKQQEEGQGTAGDRPRENLDAAAPRCLLTASSLLAAFCPIRVRLAPSGLFGTSEARQLRGLWRVTLLPPRQPRQAALRAQRNSASAAARSGALARHRTIGPA